MFGRGGGLGGLMGGGAGQMPGGMPGGLPGLGGPGDGGLPPDLAKLLKNKK